MVEGLTTINEGVATSPLEEAEGEGVGRERAKDGLKIVGRSPGNLQLQQGSQHPRQRRIAEFNAIDAS